MTLHKVFGHNKCFVLGAKNAAKLRTKVRIYKSGKRQGQVNVFLGYALFTRDLRFESFNMIDTKAYNSHKDRAITN